MTQDAQPSPARRFHPLWLTLLPMALVVILYAPTRNYPFIGFDDEEYIAFNPFVAGGLNWTNFVRAMTTFFGANWHPLTTISWQAEVSLYGLRAGLIIFDNVLLHAVCCVLLFAVLWKLTGSRFRSLAVTLLFAIHPLRVESVAWAIERKDTLSLFFGLWTIAAYAWYTRKPGRARYLLVMLLLALGLMSKPMLVTWPVLLLLLDVWPLRRWKGRSSGLAGSLLPSDAGASSRLNDVPMQRTAFYLFIEKIPLLVMCAISSYVTILAQKAAAAMRPLDEIRPVTRLLMTPANYFEYVFKTFWPWPQSIYYPYPAELPVGKVVLGILILTVVTVFALQRLKIQPALAVGWGWFLLTLVPVIGLLQTGGQNIADRYSYHTSIGFFVALVWLGDDLRRRFNVSPRVAWAGLTISVVACCVATRSYVRLWSDPVVLFQHALDVTPTNWMAHSQLGYYDIVAGNWEKAEVHLRESLRLSKSNDMAHHNLAIVLEKLGRYEEALANIRSVQLSASAPAEPHVIAGRLLIRLKRYPQALVEAEAALRYTPDDSRVHRQLAFLYEQAGNLERAAFHFARVKQLEASGTATKE